jgi:long-chain acyl-CoA synthetase
MANRATHLFARAEECGDRTALHFERERYSFRDLARRVREAAGGLAALGVRKGSHIGIMIPSSPDFIVLQHAAFALGAVVSPLNIFYRQNEVAHAIQSCDLEFVILPSDLLDRMPCTAETLPSLRSLVLIDGDAPERDRIVSLREAVRGSTPLETLVPVADDDVAMLLLTSATTGKSKGVELTAANLAENYDRTPAWLGLDGDAVILCALPLYNTFGLNQCINAMMVTGAKMVLLPRFEAKKCIDAIARYGCTFLPAVPTMLQKIFDDPEARSGTLGSITRIMTGGAPVPAALLTRVLAATGKDTVVLTGYGLTEGTALVTLVPVRLGPDGEVEHGRTIGRVLDGMTIGIMNDDGVMLGTDSVGEIVIRGPNLMRGYYNAPDDTAAALADGWLHSGDLGYIDGDGYAFIVDRKKDIIIRGGQNIYPADIEEVIYRVAGVAEVAVVGTPDDILGEVPIVFVALQPGSQVSASMLLDRCNDELARYKQPAAIHFLPELPKGPTGKILRRELKPRALAAA